eukprot:76411-Prymnesium_polylepis.2
MARVRARAKAPAKPTRQWAHVLAAESKPKRAVRSAGHKHQTSGKSAIHADRGFKPRCSYKGRSNLQAVSRCISPTLSGGSAAIRATIAHICCSSLSPPIPWVTPRPANNPSTWFLSTSFKPRCLRRRLSKADQTAFDPCKPWV